MNPSSSNLSNEINIEKEFPQILPDFEYLLSVNKTEVYFQDRALKDDYKTLDLAIKYIADHDNLFPFRRYIIRNNKRLWELHSKVEELEEILRTKIIRTDSHFYPFYLEQYRIITGYYKEDCESLLD